MYIKYDTDKDFLEQFNKNTDDLIEVGKIVVSLNAKYDNSIISKWKDLYTQEELFNKVLELMKINGRM